MAIAANAHVVSAMPNGVTVEIDRMNNPFVDELLQRPLDVVDGEIALGDEPGLGIELNWGVIERTRLMCVHVENPLFSELRGPLGTPYSVLRKGRRDGHVSIA